ncbi:hypothetical protein BH11ACT6_BH11ACT6_01810 [soil metagenome]
MPPRKDAKRAQSLESVVASLPARFLDVEVHAEDGIMTGLRAYMADLTEHLRQELGLRDGDNPPTVDAMTMLGIPPSEWYRTILLADDI